MLCQNARKKRDKMSKMKKIFEKTEKFSKRVFTNGVLCGKLWEIVKKGDKTSVSAIRPYALSVGKE